MATFAYNSAMSDQKLPRKVDNAVATLLRGFDLRAELDEIAFHKAGLSHSVCGHSLEYDEIPLGFPSILTVGTNNAAYGD